MEDYVSVTNATYDAIGSEYAGKSGASMGWAGEWITRLREVLPDRAVIADVGCGPGHLTRALREHGFRAIGFDLSAGMLGALGVPGLVQADMRALPAASASVDAIWCSAAVLHVPRPDVPAVFAGFARILRPGGQLALTVAEGDGETWEPLPYRPELRRYHVLHRVEPLSALLGDVGLPVDRYWRRSARRDWLHLQATRRPATVTGAPIHR